MTNIRKNRKVSSPENVFLLVAIVFGLLFTFLQPLFIEPDASYHFDSAMYLSNTVVDRAKVGMPAEDYQSLPTSFTTISQMKKDGKYFRELFETKLPVISKDRVIDKRVKIPWYKNVMHWIPALGVKVGHALYPSVGSMIITARLFNLIFFILSMYFIIKKLKVYQLLFAVISLTPTVIQMATSLSYDCFNYVASAWLIAMVFNLLSEIKEEKEISFLSATKRLVLPSIALYFSKENSYLLFFLVLAVFIYLAAKKLKVHLTKKETILGIVVCFLLGLSYLVLKFHAAANLHLIFSKFFYTFLEPYYTVLTTEVISGTSTAGVPAWFFVIQFAVLILLFLSYSKERLPRWFAWLAAAISGINLFGVLFKFAINHDFLDRVITGPQGRYFTVFILLLAPIFTLLARYIKVQSTGGLKKLVLLVSVLALLFNLGITSLKFYHFQAPADEFRSGVTHYIFK